MSERAIAGYRVGPALGRGAVATVFEVNGDDRALAIKLLNPQRGAAAPLSAERFLREAKAAGRLDHPHIARVVDHGVDEGVAYLVMERVVGESLAQRLVRGPLPVDDALRIAAQIAEALAHAHGHGVIHRDVKPANVMLAGDTTSVEARLVDFGLARDRLDLPLTATGALCGTPAYMAPELVDGEPASASSDVYALGCVLFEMVAGRAPFVGTLPHVFRGHAYEAAPAASSVRERGASEVGAELWAEVDALIGQCLAKNAAGRPALDAVARACLDALDPSPRWRAQLARLHALVAERFGDSPPPEVERPLRRLTEGVARLAEPATEAAVTKDQAVIVPGRAHTLAQLELFAAQIDRALDQFGKRPT